MCWGISSSCTDCGAPPNTTTWLGCHLDATPGSCADTFIDNTPSSHCQACSPQPALSSILTTYTPGDAYKTSLAHWSRLRTYATTHRNTIIRLWGSLPTTSSLLPQLEWMYEMIEDMLLKAERKVKLGGELDTQFCMPYHAANGTVAAQLESFLLQYSHVSTKMPSPEMWDASFGFLLAHVAQLVEGEVVPSVPAKSGRRDVAVPSVPVKSVLRKIGAGEDDELQCSINQSVWLSKKAVAQLKR